ncbi:hypothetical protein ACFOY2_22500 [Nonomuraea purpurea]|uniref:DUF3558 domain-containing protein n=1 Tax=Nonomuraea purpurea TaxID=1849276 RepID=A0ABV8GBF8_9ACTN
MNDRPTQPRPPRPGIRVTPVLLSGAMAVLVLMVFTIAFLLTREPPQAQAASAATTTPVPVRSATDPPPTADVPDAQPSTSEPVPTGEAKFTKELDPCGLLAEDLLAKLVLFPKKSQIYKEECEWYTNQANRASLPENMSFTLKVYAKVFPEGVAKAHEQFIARRWKAETIPGEYAKADPAIGDDSYVTRWTTPSGTGRGPTTAVVGVRLSNAVIEVRYDRRVAEDPEGRLARGALDAAKALADKIGTGTG